MTGVLQKTAAAPAVFLRGVVEKVDHGIVVIGQQTVKILQVAEISGEKTQSGPGGGFLLQGGHRHPAAEFQKKRT